MADENVVSEVVVTARKPPVATGVQVFSPRISVVLKKNIARKAAADGVPASERFQGAERTVDLTRFLAEGDAVTVRRSVREPAGAWSVTLTDQIADPDQMESLYGLVEPMDLVEIRAARTPTTDELPILMRGFVSEVRRRVAMTDTGPQRQVILSGQDYGKILQIMQVIYLPGKVIGQNLLTAFKLFLNYGPEVKEYQSAADFISEVNDTVLKPFLANMRDASGSGSNSSPLLDIQVDATVGGGSVSPFGAQEWPGGSVYDLLRYFGDVGAWNELYVEDRSDGPWLVYRPTPFKAVGGDGFIQEGASAASIQVLDETLIELETQRSDADVANYFWVAAPRYDMLDGALLQAAQAGQLDPSPEVDDHPNCSPKLYGERLMQLETQQGLRLDGQSQDGLTSGTPQGIALTNDRRKTLIENNKDNVVLERGMLILRGDEAVRAGMYIWLNRGGRFAYEVYGHTVTQSYVVGRTFETAVEFDRGTGFVERIQRGSGTDSAYLAELNAEGVYASALG